MASFSDKFFLSFLKQHAKSLQSLTLVGIDLTTSIPQRFFCKLKSQMRMFLKLDKVDLRGTFGFTMEENGNKLVHSIDMGEEVDTDGCTIGMEISNYLLNDGEYPFDKKYWKSDHTRTYRIML